MGLPLNINLQQIFLHMFNFVILIGGLYLILYKPVKDFMDKRKAYYENLEKESREKLTEANSLKEQYEKSLEQADDEIAQKKVTAEQELEKKCQLQLASAHKEAADILKRAREQGEREKAQMVTDARREIANMAAEATKKLLYSSDAGAFDDFLDSAEGSKKNE